MRASDVAVVGGGIFGVTAAIELARAGLSVTLYERAHDLLRSTSAINQYRLHRGYHYPRSAETAAACHSSEAQFAREYGEALVDGVIHHYCIARERSKTSADAFLAFCEAQDLELVPGRPEFVRADSIALSVKVREGLFDADKLREVCWQRLRELEVDVRLRVEANSGMVANYRHVVVATYARLNEFLSNFPEAIQQYQFELCEKPVVRLPRRFAGHSVVIMDGPFMCIDPFGRSSLFVLGNVVHAIHATQVGTVPRFDPAFAPLLDRGVIPHPPITAFPKFVAAAEEFFDGIGAAEHVGSMFTIRAVPAFKDETDERPTLVRRHSDRLFTIFSGKIGTCVAAARDLRALISGGSDRAVAQTERATAQR